MYRYGSSARAGVGKRGHGGRDYKPPPERRDPNSTPPPLKQCGCLLELHIEEYGSVAPQGRAHHAFGGRRVVEDMERHIRSNFCVHLILPGRKQTGPVAVVGRTHREAVPAALYLMQILSSNPRNSEAARSHVNGNSAALFPIAGRVFLDTKRPDRHLSGAWQRSDEAANRSQWLFTSIEHSAAPSHAHAHPQQSWSALSCSLRLFASGSDEVSTTDDSDGNGDGDGENTSDGNSSGAASEGEDHSKDLPDPRLQSAAALKTCMGNVVFRLGKECVSKLDLFFHGDFAFCVGDSQQSQRIHDEIKTMLQSARS